VADLNVNYCGGVFCKNIPKIRGFAGIPVVFPVDKWVFSDVVTTFRVPIYCVGMAQADGPWTVERLLTWMRQFFERKAIDAPRLSAELLLAHVLGVPRIKLYTGYQDVLNDEQLKVLRDLTTRAGNEEPIAYLTGKAHFFNLEFAVTSAVLIPRPDTETLVEQAMRLFRDTLGFEAPRVLDLCTGSGCIAIAIAKHKEAAQVTAVDISADALAVAERNVESNGVGDRVTLFRGDLFEPLDALPDPTPFDVILSNPPYIPQPQLAGLPKNVKDYEPSIALDGGSDGHDFHRRILTGAAGHWLRPGGHLLMEIAYDQLESSEALVAGDDTWTGVKVLRDHAGNPRVLAVQKKPEGEAQ
jgi:release factor glutamine methyltransferase